MNDRACRHGYHECKTCGKIKEHLKNLYYNVLDVENNCDDWLNKLQLGEEIFLYLDLDEKDGIIKFIHIPFDEIERIEGEDPNNPNYIQFKWDIGMIFENWQILHFRTWRPNSQIVNIHINFELVKAGYIHLFTLGYRGDDLLKSVPEFVDNLGFFLKHKTM